MAMNRCLINVALAIGSSGLLAPLMPGVTALAQSRRQQPHPGHEQGSGHEHGHGHVGSGTAPAFPGKGSYVPVFGLPKSVTEIVDKLNKKINDKDWVRTEGKYVHITIDEKFLNLNGSHEFLSKDDLDKAITDSHKKIQEWLYRAKSQNNYLKFRNLDLQHSYDANENILYLKLMLDRPTDGTTLATITKPYGVSSGRHITVGHFNIKDASYLKTKQSYLDRIIKKDLMNLVNEEEKNVAPFPLESVRIIRTDNKNAIYETYMTFPPGKIPPGLPHISR